MLVVISGGSQGLGASLAKIHVQKGHDVVIVARTKSKLVAAVQELEKHRPSPTPETQTIRYVVADVADPAACADAFGTIGEIPDLVFCCAGAARPGMFLQLSPDELKQSMKTVYDTALFFSHAALQVMANAPDKFNQRRHLVYCSSVVAVFPLIGYSSYAPGKAAIRNLSDIVRQECLLHNIRVSHVLPGNMATEGFEVEELTKPEITKKIEGSSTPLAPDICAQHVQKYLDRGSDTIYTDTIGWVLGSSMLGTSPRYGFGILQAIMGVLLSLFGPIVAFFVNKDITDSLGETKDPKEAEKGDKTE